MFRKIKGKKVELLTYVMIVFVFIITAFGLLNIYKSCKIINNQANSNFVYLAQDVRERENDYFHTAEDETEHCKRAIEITIDKQKFYKILPYVPRYEEHKIPYIENYLSTVVSPILLYSTKHIQGLTGIYFDFDHELLINKDLIARWYVDRSLKGDFKLTENGPTSDMEPTTRPELKWFYLPKKLKKGVWSAPYTDADLKIPMITYSTPVYLDKTFIGVMGVDISMEEVKNFIYKFKIYNTGKAYLVDNNNKIIYAKGYGSLISTSAIDKKLYDFLDKASINKRIELNGEDVKLVKSENKKKLFAVTKLFNDFILVLEVPFKELYAETYKLIWFTSFLLAFAILISLLIATEAYVKIKRINNELIHKEKLISMGTMSAEIAHELNNPIGFLSCNMDTLKKFLDKIKTLIIYYEAALQNILLKKSSIEKEIEDINKQKEELKMEYVLESLDEIIEESKQGVKRVSNIVLNLKTFAKNDKIDAKSSESLEEIIDESLLLLHNKIKSDIAVKKNFSNIPNLVCNKNQLQQVFVNLLDNAIYSVEKKGRKDKKISITLYKKGKNAFVEIEDNGLGIEKNKINKIFDTFFTTKSHSEGTGLGLSVVHEIITKKHKGEISVESKPMVGTKFIIKLPY